MIIHIKHYKRAGFTLIEIMIVIAIIAILAGIMVPNFMRARAEAQLTTCTNNVRILSEAMHMAYIHNIKQKMSDVDGHRSGVDWLKGMTDTYEMLIDEGYVTSIPRCPLFSPDEEIRYSYIIEHCHGGYMPNLICPSLGINGFQCGNEVMIYCVCDHIIKDTIYVPFYVSSIGCFCSEIPYSKVYD